MDHTDLIAGAFIEDRLIRLGKAKEIIAEIEKTKPSNIIQIGFVDLRYPLDGIKYRFILAKNDSVDKIYLVNYYRCGRYKHLVYERSD